jgi:hypothetical protein
LDEKHDEKTNAGVIFKKRGRFLKTKSVPKESDKTAIEAAHSKAAVWESPTDFFLVTMRIKRMHVGARKGRRGGKHTQTKRGARRK